ncbi:hypothetical protein [Burkholderia cenocepacia]|uniref:Bbp19 family protein n=1 Tax=Burkholderia cenocepacia TaxID=95486 RepID=UPI001B9806D9|nr:hypothetical protein [Burkholderia cenocepacia]MBR7942350.1 hypothetical protein [Burkholderia cenocepacia]
MKAQIEGAPAEQRATPEDYRIAFESPVGALVLDDLVRRFTGAVFVSGGQDGERETTFRLGRRETVEHILRMINRANGAEPEGE